MSDKAGQMETGNAWLFMIAAALGGTALAFLSLKVSIPGKVLYLAYLALFGGAAYASVFLTKAGKGLGIGASFVSAALLAIGSYLVTSMIVAAAATKGIDLKDAAGAQNGHVALSEGAGAVAGAIGGVIVAFVNFVVAAVGGIVGAVVGGNMKKKALATITTSAVYARAA